MKLFDVDRSAFLNL